MEIMDAGLSDNFGVSDAVRFLYVFRHWIGENTSGVILLSIRDTPKEHFIEKNAEQSLWDKVATPVGGLYRNWSHLQDIQNDNSVQYAGRWLAVPLLQADLTYDAAAPVADTDTAETPNGRRGQRASLSWRLTEREKAGIRQAIHNDPNQATIRQLQAWLEQHPGKPEIQLTHKQVPH
jgi:hypothetical protein